LIESGEKKPDTRSGSHYFRWMLAELNVPASSQLLVVSRTGLQRKVVSPETPRAICFNDQTSVTWIQDGMIEVQSFDPILGPVFYILQGTEARQEVRDVRFLRRESCLNGCHAGSATNYLPGPLARSLHVDLQGNPTNVDKAGIVINAISKHENMSHAMPLNERWGGWRVTGGPLNMNHLGNILVPRGSKPVSFPDITAMVPALPHGSSSHIVPLLIHDHQVGLMNKLYEALYRWRTHDYYAQKINAGFKDERLTMITSTQIGAVNEALDKLVAEILFKDEAALPGVQLEAQPAFLKSFQAQARSDPQGRSLRELELKTRIMKYRCSHLVQSPQVLGMPEPFKRELYCRLRKALAGQHPAGGHLPEQEREAIHDILLATQPGYSQVVAKL
jgi:hypothetical protein